LATAAVSHDDRPRNPGEKLDELSWVDVGSCGTSAAARGEPMSSERQLEVLHEVFDGFNRHDIDVIMSYFADDCVFESPRGPDPWGRRFVGKDDVRRGLAARLEGMPDVRYDNGEHFASGSRGVSEWTICGTTVDGERVEVRGCDLWTFGDDGRIIRKDSFWKLRDG
jgi:ketosteroid isomerase-like protein